MMPAVSVYGPDCDVAALPPDGPPYLIVAVHTEEEFDWSQPFDRTQVGVTHIQALSDAQSLFAGHGLRPVYVVDWPVIDQDASSAVLRALCRDDAAIIGTHLHPWVSPPHDEPVTAQNSYPGNLPEPLERAKITALTERIGAVTGRRPDIYLAGRYGFGPNTGRILVDLGYRIDLSSVVGYDYRAGAGPDYRSIGPDPFWCRPHGDARRLLCLPHTAGMVGGLCRRGRLTAGWLETPLAVATGLRRVAGRLAGIEQLRLSPEGFTLENLKRLTRALVGDGVRAFVLSFHSPSLQPGHTPYVRTGSDRQAFLERLDHFLTFFRDEIGGELSDPYHLERVVGEQ